MWNTLNKLETLALLIVTVGLAVMSARQHTLLRTVQLDQKKALYAERLRTAQTLLENELLRSAHHTSIHDRTRALARSYLQRSPQ